FLPFNYSTLQPISTGEEGEQVSYIFFSKSDSSGILNVFRKSIVFRTHHLKSILLDNDSFVCEEMTGAFTLRDMNGNMRFRNSFSLFEHIDGSSVAILAD